MAWEILPWLKNVMLKLGVNVCISSDKKQIQSASHLILPGVGSFESES